MYRIILLLLPPLPLPPFAATTNTEYLSPTPRRTSYPLEDIYSMHYVVTNMVLVWYGFPVVLQTFLSSLISLMMFGINDILFICTHGSVSVMLQQVYTMIILTF